MKSKEGRPYWLFLKEYAFKKKLFPFYLLTIVIIVLTAGVSLVRPELQGKVVDDLGNPQNTNLSAFMFLLGIFLGMLLLNYLMNYAQRYIVAVISEEIAADMRQKVEDKLSTVSVNFFEKIKLSDILLKVDKDVSAVKQCGITSIITLVSNMVILVVVPPYMFSIHKGIAVSNIILLVSVPFISRILGKLIQETSGQVLDGYNSITNVLTNTYDNWFITRLFQCGQYVHDMYFEKNQKYKKETNRQNLLYILNTSTILVIQFIGTVIIWVVGAQEVFKGKSGQGKSTLFKIIAGVYQPTEGNIIVNDTDLQELDINNYWENTGYVMQRTQFFNDTVRRNMGLLHIVSEEEMDTVAKCLDLYDEIHALEMVWDTEIKIDPCNFSEGQMRRLDIMRNILKNSQLLIFDEATANIDEKRRGNFYHLLHELSKDKIIIFSTHNLEELREADIIVDLEKLHIRQVSEK